MPHIPDLFTPLTLTDAFSTVRYRVVMLYNLPTFDWVANLPPLVMISSTWVHMVIPAIAPCFTPLPCRVVILGSLVLGTHPSVSSHEVRVAHHLWGASRCPYRLWIHPGRRHFLLPEYSIVLITEHFSASLEDYTLKFTLIPWLLVICA